MIKVVLELWNPFFTWVAVPLFIFLARVLDVSMGTMRMIFISKGYKKYASLIGFFEVIIWLLAISQIIKNINSIHLIFAYAAGFSVGTYVGIIIEEKISLGKVVLQIVTTKAALGITEALRAKGFKVTCIDGDSTDGKAKILFTLINRKELTKAIKIVRKFNRRAFYSVSDVKAAYEKIEESNSKSYKDILKSVFLLRKK